MPRLFLIDAYAMIYRAYYSFINRPMTNSRGENTSAILGFVNSINDILKKENPSHIAVVFDPPSLTFRNDLCPSYKAQRPPTPEGIKFALPWIKKIIDLLGIKQVMVEKYEADDIIGTLAKKAEKDGFEVFMVTPDKDYNQLVSDNIKIYKPKKNNADIEIIDAKEFCAQTGLQNPLQFIDILALWGDASDNVKGVTGIGEKTAYKLIQDYGSIDNIYENISKLKGKQKENFINDREVVNLARTLVTIVTDAPIEFSADEFAKHEPNEEALKAVFQELEFKNLAERLFGKTAAPQQPQFEQGTLFFDGGIETVAPPEPIHYETAKTTAHTYHLVNTVEKIKELADNLLKQKEFCFDTETDSLTIHQNHLVGMSFAWEPHVAYYIPFDPKNEAQANEYLEILKPALTSPEILKIGQNIKFDILVLRNYGIEVCGNLFDTMVAHYMIQPEQRHNMDYLSEVYLKYTPIHIEELIGEKGKNQKSMQDVDIELIKEYAAEDADVTYMLKNALYAELDKTGVLKATLEIEMPLIYVLAEMEYAGVCIDTDFLKEYTKTLNNEIIDKEKEIYDYAKHNFNIGSPRQLGVVLFEELKIDPDHKRPKQVSMPQARKNFKNSKISTRLSTLYSIIEVSKNL